MDNYADYKFYTDEYKGKLSDDLFSSCIVKASRIIDGNVNRELNQEVIEQLSERDQYKLKYVACELCDYINTNGSSGSGSEKASSISIDGVSITSDTKSETQIANDRSVILSELPIELTRYI